jgi:Tfp pilus assembly protein PilX
MRWIEGKKWMRSAIPRPVRGIALSVLLAVILLIGFFVTVLMLFAVSEPSRETSHISPRHAFVLPRGPKEG